VQIHHEQISCENREEHYIVRAKVWAILMVLSAIQLGASQQSANPAVGIPEEVGIYSVLRGDVKEAPAETVEAHRGGLLGLNGEIAISHSILRLSRPQEFIIRTAEGYSASEYALLKLVEKKDRRQFRALTVHVGGATDNASKNLIPFIVERLNNHAWRVRLNLDEGEYAFFSPQIHSSGLGKSLAYTFGVDSSPVPGTAVQSIPSSASDSASPAANQSDASATLLGATFANLKEGGVEITSLLPNSLIQAAGLRVGDVIKAVDLKPVKTAEDFRQAIADRGPGANVRISYVFLESRMWWVQRDVNVHLTR
jgi:hypothetical protein